MVYIILSFFSVLGLMIESPLEATANVFWFAALVFFFFSTSDKRFHPPQNKVFGFAPILVEEQFLLEK